MSLNDAEKIAQIAFYGSTLVLAFLTYRSAKRGLLNTVNTEYQKRAMDRIQQLSDELLAEFDPRSPNFWYHDWEIERYVKPVFDAAVAARDGGCRAGNSRMASPTARAWQGFGISCNE